MKRFIGLLVDVLFFISFIGSMATLALVIVYTQTRDISVVNIALQSHLVPTLIATYGGLLLLYLIYFWLIPTVLKQTVGQRIAGTSYASENKITIGRVFLKTIVGRFWDVLFFPYTLFAILTKRQIISTRLSQIVISKVEKKPTAGLYIGTLFFSLCLVTSLAVGTYVYRTGITPIIEQYTDYEKQVKDLIDKMAFQDATPALEKYKQYNGDNANYSYYNCVIQANLSTEQQSIDLCKTAEEKNSGNVERIKEILGQQAKLFAANDNYTEAEKLYSRIWNEFNDRSMNMKNYVVVLSELGKSEDATKTLDELAKQIPSTDAVALKDLGNLYERIGNIDKALEQYTTALGSSEGIENQSLAGELNYYIGVVQYSKAKYTEAKASFEKAKELNKDFADPADSYIILISELKNSVTK